MTTLTPDVGLETGSIGPTTIAGLKAVTNLVTGKRCTVTGGPVTSWSRVGARDCLAKSKKCSVNALKNTERLQSAVHPTLGAKTVIMRGCRTTNRPEQSILSKPVTGACTNVPRLPIPESIYHRSELRTQSNSSARSSLSRTNLQSCHRLRFRWNTGSILSIGYHRRCLSGRRRRLAGRQNHRHLDNPVVGDHQARRRQDRRYQGHLAAGNHLVPRHRDPVHRIQVRLTLARLRPSRLGMRRMTAQNHQY